MLKQQTEREVSASIRLGRATVTEDYETPFGRFTGEISWVRIDISKEVFEDEAGEEAALAGRS